MRGKELPLTYMCQLSGCISKGSIEHATVLGCKQTAMASSAHHAQLPHLTPLVLCCAVLCKQAQQGGTETALALVQCPPTAHVACDRRMEAHSHQLLHSATPVAGMTRASHTHRRMHQAPGVRASHTRTRTARTLLLGWPAALLAACCCLGCLGLLTLLGLGGLRETHD